jgi:hypothetical protein
LADTRSAGEDRAADDECHPDERHRLDVFAVYEHAGEHGDDRHEIDRDRRACGANACEQCAERDERKSSAERTERRDRAERSPPERRPAEAEQREGAVIAKAPSCERNVTASEPYRCCSGTDTFVASP